ncbi:hypothetical protein PPL_09011 [Heterostelium album PN500]|uniref:Uncharacterized protein n=1 Tax=Heterostelium pallidum (strain ATCC 26659 / Pp 5 / PN500) TaxID=670386 RepID=D3BKD0_HETP5|nr:hypothetical protein PPL_09011 [Heterostelium album PN500]EFA78360.1 hypothetical protein PPL_09011 [Heterostelium album PN500]|eukprot:XP_020430485.1 hypothetical protein PPL_09011 [Heterostelium album PN500]
MEFISVFKIKVKYLNKVTLGTQLVPESFHTTSFVSTCCLFVCCYIFVPFNTFSGKLTEPDYDHLKNSSSSIFVVIIVTLLNVSICKSSGVFRSDINISIVETYEESNFEEYFSNHEVFWITGILVPKDGCSAGTTRICFIIDNEKSTTSQYSFVSQHRHLYIVFMFHTEFSLSIFPGGFHCHLYQHHHWRTLPIVYFDFTHLHSYSSTLKYLDSTLLLYTNP